MEPGHEPIGTEAADVMPVGWLANNTFKASSVAIWQSDPLKNYL